VFILLCEISNFTILNVYEYTPTINELPLSLKNTDVNLSSAEKVLIIFEEVMLICEFIDLI
jgi:hypothetical protein